MFIRCWQKIMSQMAVINNSSVQSVNEYRQTSINMIIELFDSKDMRNLADMRGVSSESIFFSDLKYISI